MDSLNEKSALLFEKLENNKISLIVVCVLSLNITKTCLFKYIENCTCKNSKFSDKKLRYFFIFLLKT